MRNIFPPSATGAWRYGEIIVGRRKKSTRTRRGTSIAKADTFAKALRADYANQFGEIANSVAWLYEENKDVPASKLGGLLHRRIVEANEKARVLFGEFVERLYVVRGAPKWVCRAAKKAWPLFNEKCSGFVAPGDLANWQELALTGAQHQTGKEKGHRSRASHFQHGEDFSWVEAEEGERILLIIRNRLGEEIDRVEGARDLWGKDLRGRQWAHADLSGMLLDGADLAGANLLGARLVNTSFCRANLRGAEVSFAKADGANFFRANLDGCLMYKTEIRNACFDEAKISHDSDVPNWRTSYADKPNQTKERRFRAGSRTSAESVGPRRSDGSTSKI
jgi:uncharacterized protein YjbI with pentapeptide repeats